MQNTQSYERQSALLHELVANALQPNKYELLRHLGQVLGLKPTDQVLLIVGAGSDEVQQALAQEFGCQIELFQGELRELPYENAQFHSVIVAVPITKNLHSVAHELSRVLQPAGSLGMIVFSMYRDQMPEHAEFDQMMPLIDTARPSAVYRAVLAECGFTAFVSKDRRRDFQRIALSSYREHMLHSVDEAAVQSPETIPWALDLIASGSVSITLITAEKCS